MQPERSGQDEALARQGRVVAVVIALGGLVALVAPWLTQILGLAPKYEMLFYLIALAAFVWALVVSFQIRHKLRKK